MRHDRDVHREAGVAECWNPSETAVVPDGRRCGSPVAKETRLTRCPIRSRVRYEEPYATTLSSKHTIDVTVRTTIGRTNRLLRAVGCLSNVDHRALARSKSRKAAEPAAIAASTSAGDKRTTATMTAHPAATTSTAARRHAPSPPKNANSRNAGLIRATRPSCHITCELPACLSSKWTRGLQVRFCRRRRGLSETLVNQVQPQAVGS